MTKVKYKSRPVWHETHTADRMTGRLFLIAESPGALLIRLKGTRQVLDLPWSLCYLRAATLKGDDGGTEQGQPQTTPALGQTG